jgi:LAO/AO transport system kinase
MLDMSEHGEWRPPIVETSAVDGTGVADLWVEIERHRDWSVSSGVLAERRRFRLQTELREIVGQRIEERAREVCSGERWDDFIAAVGERRTDPWTAADEMLRSAGA